MSEQEFDQLRQAIYAHSGIVIAPDKQFMIRARLQRRIKALRLTSLSEYLSLINDKTEREVFISSLTTNVTNFFREDHHFKMMVNRALPECLDSRDDVQIWSAGCSSGQEPYSIAITIYENFPSYAERIKILATDIDSKILHYAKSGQFTRAEIQSIPADLLSRYFNPLHNSRPDIFHVIPQLTKMVRFKQANLNSSWMPDQQFDIIFCRNVAIYFDRTAQEALWRKFHLALRPKGWLLIGHSERIPEKFHHMLTPCGITAYQKKS